jgi:poly-gamma-glutamate synthesis protein (capsule biosynthesis protein)
VVPLPSAGGSRLLVWAVGHSSSGVPGAWAAGQHRPGGFVTDLSPAGVRQLGDLVQQHKQPGDIALVSGGRVAGGQAGWKCCQVLACLPAH